MTRPSRTSLLQYGFIALPVAFAGFPLYVLAPDFYATRYGLSLALLGQMLLVIRLFDAVLDPLLGWLADNLMRNSFRLMAGAGALLCLAVMALFNLAPLPAALWFAACMLAAVTAYSLLVILLGARATLWTTDRDDQTRLAAAREGFGLAGLVLAVSLPSLLQPVLGENRAYLGYVVILSVLMLLALAFYARLPAVAVQSSLTRVSIAQALRHLRGESLRLFAVYGLGMFASSIPAVLVVFYIRDYLGAEQLLGPFLLLYFLSGAMAMPLWKTLSQRLGKPQAWALANLLAVAGFSAVPFLQAGDAWAYGAVCLVSGMALGADLTLPPSMLADQIHAAHNSRYSATHYACLNFVAKAGLALASATALPVLDAAGFHPGGVNTPAALATLSSTYGLAPCALKLISSALMYRFFIRSSHR